MFYSGVNNNVSSMIPLLTKLDIIREQYPKYMPVGRDEYIKAAEHFSGHVRSPRYPQIYLTEFTAATGGTTGCYSDSVVDYATARNATTAAATDNRIGNEISGGHYNIFRWFCPTDFTTITAGSDVTAADGYVWGITSQVAWLDDTMRFILTTQAATTTVALADFDNITLNSPTEYGTTAAYTVLDTSAYSAAITMTAGFQTLVEAAAGVGFVKMGLRANADIVATTPTGTSNLTMSTADNQRTKFDITWTLPVLGGNYSFFM